MRWFLGVVLAAVLAGLVAAAVASLAAQHPAAQQPATVYCSYGSNPAVGFLGACPPGFHQVTR